MAWSERQAKMLQAMGLRLWSAPMAATPPVATLQAEPRPAAAPTSPPLATAPVPPAPPVPSLPPVLAPGPVPAVAGLDWLELRQAVVNCQACSLHKSRKQTVFGAGHPQAHWLIVGEAPGAQEDEEGEPFVGASGQLLDGMLLALGLSRQPDGDPSRSVYIANTLKCRPPANRNPQAQELQACSPFLQRQLALLQPRVVLAMGRYAVQALLNDSAPLGQLRGQVHQLGGRPLVVTYHPSYLLRSPGEKGKAWADLCLAASVAEQAR